MTEMISLQSARFTRETGTATAVFAEKILSAYRWGPGTPGEADLLHLLLQPLGPMEDGADPAVWNQRITMICRFLNRLLLSVCGRMTWQDGMYVDRMLVKLGIRDSREFLQRLRETIGMEQRTERLSAVYRELPVYKRERREQETPGAPPEKDTDLWKLVYRRLKLIKLGQRAGGRVRTACFVRGAVGPRELLASEFIRASEYAGLALQKDAISGQSRTEPILPVPVYEMAGKKASLPAAVLLSLANGVYTAYTAGGEAPLSRPVWMRIEPDLLGTANSAVKRFISCRKEQREYTDSIRYYEELAARLLKEEYEEIKKMFPVSRPLAVNRIPVSGIGEDRAFLLLKKEVIRNTVAEVRKYAHAEKEGTGGIREPLPAHKPPEGKRFSEKPDMPELIPKRQADGLTSPQAKGKDQTGRVKTENSPPDPYAPIRHDLGHHRQPPAGEAPEGYELLRERQEWLSDIETGHIEREYLIYAEQEGKREEEEAGPAAEGHSEGLTEKRGERLQTPAFSAAKIEKPGKVFQKPGALTALVYKKSRIQNQKPAAGIRTLESIVRNHTMRRLRKAEIILKKQESLPEQGKPPVYYALRTLFEQQRRAREREIKKILLNYPYRKPSEKDRPAATEENVISGSSIREAGIPFADLSYPEREAEVIWKEGENGSGQKGPVQKMSFRQWQVIREEKYRRLEKIMEGPPARRNTGEPAKTADIPLRRPAGESGKQTGVYPGEQPQGTSRPDVPHRQALQERLPDYAGQGEAFPVNRLSGEVLRGNGFPLRIDRKKTIEKQKLILNGQGLLFGEEKAVSSDHGAERAVIKDASYEEINRELRHAGRFPEKREILLGRLTKTEQRVYREIEGYETSRETGAASGIKIQRAAPGAVMQLLALHSAGMQAQTKEEDREGLPGPEGIPLIYKQPAVPETAERGGRVKPEKTGAGAGIQTQIGTGAHTEEIKQPAPWKETVTRLVKNTVKESLDTVTDQVYKKLERKLKSDRIRRGLM